jgi:hypothetical protein
MESLKTSGLKLSELRPCDNCSGKIAPIFSVIEIKMAVFNARNVNAVLGTNQIFGGRALKLAEAMAPGADDAVEVLENKDGITTLFLCQQCCMADVCLAVLSEKVHKSRITNHESL